MDEYRSISESSQAVIREKGSKFIGLLIPIASEGEFKLKLEDIKSEHHKANHHCYAIRIWDQQLERYNDDGEPSNTAGRPILSQLAQHDLWNVALVVIRYFGGTKLGIRGLIDAYGESAKLAIQASKFTTVSLTSDIKIEAKYEATSFIERFVSQYNLSIADERYEERMYKTIKVPQSQLLEITTLLSKAMKEEFGYNQLAPIEIIEPKKVNFE